MRLRLPRFSRAFTAILLLWSVLFQSSIQGAIGTAMPAPFQTVFDGSGNPINGGKVCTYLAGTTTAVQTYTDANLSVANNPVITADSAGRFVAFLTPGVSYKFVYQSAAGTVNTCDGVTYRTIDGIIGVPAATSTVDFTCTAGEAITAGQAVYLSDGSGSRTQGQCYKGDNVNGYSSSVPLLVGIAPSAIGSGQSGTVRLAGSVTGLSSLSVGSTYYVGVSGALTSTSPSNLRKLGVADTATSLVLSAAPSTPLAWADDFRLTLTSGTCITTADVLAATTLYLSPCDGNRLDLPDASGNPQRTTTAELSIAVPATTSQMYDVYVYLNSSTPTLELLAWTNDTTRATAIVRTNGRWTKTGDFTRLYVGSFRTTTVSGQTEDSLLKRYVWNYYNQKPRMLKVFETTASWAYTTATVRQANGSTANQVDLITGVAENPIDLLLSVPVSNTGAVTISAGIGEDSTTTYAAGSACALNSSAVVTARLVKIPAVGRHFYSWNEWSAAVGTTTWQGITAGAGSTITSGISGYIQG